MKTVLQWKYQKNSPILTLSAILPFDSNVKYPTERQNLKRRLPSLFVMKYFLQTILMESLLSIMGLHIESSTIFYPGEFSQWLNTTIH